MTNKLLYGLLVVVLLVALVASSALATNRPETIKAKSRLFRISEYALPLPIADGQADQAATSGTKTAPPASLGGKAITSSPGSVIYSSYRDMQQNSTMGRMVDWRNWPYINFSVMSQPTLDPNIGRTGWWGGYDATNGTWPATQGIGCPIQGTGQKGGFVALDVDTTGSPIITLHRSIPESANPKTVTFWDQAFGVCFWGSGSQIPDTMNDRLALISGDAIIWPKIDYQVFGGQTVTHVAAYESTPGNTDWGTMAYYRKVGEGPGGNWTGLFIDSARNGVSVTVTSSRVSGKVAVCWTGNTPFQTQHGTSWVQLDEDVYYRMSTNMGASFGPKTDVTNYQPNVAGYRAYAELSGLFDTNDKLHLLWPGRVWPANAYDPSATVGYQCRLFHWSQNNPSVFTTVSTAEWDPINCLGGAWQLHIAKANLAECNNRLYAIWAQYEDNDWGIIDDCASAGADVYSSANGEIYMAVSTDLNGLTWDQRRDLTNSHTPGCDTVGGNGPCDSDGWPSISRYGMDVSALETKYGALSWPAEARTVFPDYTGTNYLHLQYINDKYPGSLAVPEGIATNNPVMWVMLPCVDPVPNPILSLKPRSIAYPNWIKNGHQSVQTITMENTGNEDLTISAIGTFQTAPVAPTWVTTSTSGPMTIPAGIGNTATMTVTLNVGGVINSPGTVTNLVGYVYFKSNSPVPLDSQVYTINLPVADTVVGVVLDTIATACTRLAVQSNGDMGANGVGRANMDYFYFGDCDTINSSDSIPGNTDIYLFDGSPVVLQHKTTPDTIIASWSIFNSGFATAYGFKPVVDKVSPIFPQVKQIHPDSFEVFATGQFVTVDSSIALEKTLFAPLNAGDSCHFIVQKLQIFPNKGAAVSMLAIGEAVDWDIPSDTGSLNTGGVDDARNLVFCRGYDLSPRPNFPCQSNTARYGGVAMLSYHTALDPTPKTDMYGGYTAYNKDFVYPASNFKPLELWNNMQNPGVSTATGAEDLHAVLCYKDSFTLAANDTLTVWTAMATVMNGTQADLAASIDKANQWYQDHVINFSFSCCTAPTTGDVDASGGVDISDLSAYVDYLFSFLPFPSDCFQEQDADHSGGVDISDLQALIDYLFNFLPLPPC
jgi:hypothetical protein